MNAAVDIKKEIADEAVRIVTGARRAAYGKPEQNFERIARLWRGHFKNIGLGLPTADGTSIREIEAADVAAMMRLMKEARLAETPDHRDSYVDILGYALCGAEIALAPKADAHVIGKWGAGELIQVTRLPGETIAEAMVRTQREAAVDQIAARKPGEFRVGDQVRFKADAKYQDYKRRWFPAKDVWTVKEVRDRPDDPYGASVRLVGEPMYTADGEWLELVEIAK